MLHEFLESNRDTLIERCQVLAASRRPPQLTREDMQHGIPLFLDQLIERLQSVDAAGDLATQPEAGSGEKPKNTPMSRTATQHGRELQKHGYTVDQVVHAYGDLCQATTELASERDAPIANEEFKVFNGCLDNAIAAAVTEFDRKRDHLAMESGGAAVTERMQLLAQEIRNCVSTAMLAIAVIKRGTVGMQGATAGVLDRSLVAIRDVCDEALVEHRRH